MDFEREKEHLEKILKIINDQLDELDVTFDANYEKLCNDTKLHWESLSEMDDGDEAFSEANIKAQVSSLDKSLVEARQLYDIKKSPYFGQIGVTFDDGEKEDFRIGFKTIYDKDGYPVIIDWRTGIVDLFYNSVIGKTSYLSPTGVPIECTLDSRKQIKIEDSVLKRVVDTYIHLSDDELQEVLARSSDSKMKNVVATIQQEQNKAIRSPKDKHIIVEGKAGSGKTSIGLHRLAYLLYHNKELNSRNMLIFSPSDVFSSYISNVLPEMGEENVRNTTFKEFAKNYITGFGKLESYTEFIARYYNNENDEKTNKLNEFKFSDKYKELLDKFVIKKSSEYHFNDDFELNNIKISKDKMNALLDSEALKNYPICEKIELLADFIVKSLKDKVEVKRTTVVNVIKKELIPSYSHRKTYNEFLESEEFKEATGLTDRIQNHKVVEYPDIIGMLYIYFEMFGYPTNKMIHHVLIDEAQDYTPLQLNMIKNIFSGAIFTVLGDADQTINPYYKYDSLEDMNQIFNNSNYIELDKAYRSSPEIMDYASKITGKKIDAVRASENRPVEIKEVDKKELFTTLVKDIIRLKEEGLNRICIITKNNKEATAIYDGLKDKIDNIVVLSEDESELDNNTAISPVYISKGLEFDAVINYNDKDDEYEEKDKYLYYIASTRAQHSLTIYNEPEKILKKGVK